MESEKELGRRQWVGEKLAASARLSDNAIALGNRAGIIEWANPAWTRVTGHALDRFTGKPVGDFLERIDLEPDVVDFVGGCFREKKVCEIDLPLTTPAGASIWVHLRVEPLLDFPSQSSPIDTQLFRAIVQTAEEIDPGAPVVPRVIAGFTDAHYFRDLGIVSYGFVPRWLPASETRGIHGPNERIAIENLERGVRALTRIMEVLGGAP